MRAISVSALVLAGLAAFAPGGPREAEAGDLNPPFEGLHEVFDSTNTISVTLPKLTKPVEDTTPDLIAKWRVDLYENPGLPHLTVVIFRRTAWARAAMLGSMNRFNRSGDFVEGSIRCEPHEWREQRKVEAKNSFLRYRMFEHGGEVYEAIVQCSFQTRDAIARHAERVIDSVKGVNSPPAFAAPAGFKPWPSPDREVWTDSKSKPDVERVIAMHTKMWERAKTVFTRPPAITAPPRIVICRDAKTYVELAQTAIQGGEPPPGGFVDSSRRAFVVCAGDVKKGIEAERQFERGVAVQCAQASFGGPLPYWFANGLAVYTIFTTAERTSADAPNPVAIREAKTSFAKRAETLRDLMERREPWPLADAVELDRVTWLWHWYLRSGPLMGEGQERYKKYVEAITSSGNVIEAAEAWDGCDFAALKTGLATWLKSK